VGVRIALIGPLPPPSGGMANQTRQLARLLQQADIDVELVQTNAPYTPAWVGPLRGARALFRLLPFLLRLWKAAGRVQLFHVMANSGWSWHLFAVPALCIAKLRRVPVLVNYRGGSAEQFFTASPWAKATMRLADRLVVPSGFLEQVFRRFGFAAEIVPNVVDLSCFTPRSCSVRPTQHEPHIIVTRNLEAIYDVETALRAFAIVYSARPGAKLTIAGSGPEREKLQQLAQALGIAARVAFTGRLDNEKIPQLYREADLFLNSSTVDNMPISILEALASGVPVVSTDVGGIPHLVEDGKTALLVPPRDPHAMAQALLQLVDDPAQAARLAAAGRVSVQQYSWPSVRGRLFAVYGSLTANAGRNAAAEVE
jgi:glycosyltransferase involved in cell wall biosynthesis